jgi:hypothetical protein
MYPVGEGTLLVSASAPAWEISGKSIPLLLSMSRASFWGRTA